MRDRVAADQDPMGAGFTKLQTAAVQMHETVTAMMEAGFTRPEACYFMAVFVSKNPGPAPDKPPSTGGN